MISLKQICAFKVFAKDNVLPRELGGGQTKLFLKKCARCIKWVISSLYLAYELLI